MSLDLLLSDAVYATPFSTHFTYEHLLSRSTIFALVRSHHALFLLGLGGIALDSYSRLIGVERMEHCNCGHQRRQHGSNLECKKCDCLKYKAVGDRRVDIA